MAELVAGCGGGSGGDDATPSGPPTISRSEPDEAAISVRGSLRVALTIENITRAQVATLKVYITDSLSGIAKTTFVSSGPRVLIEVLPGKPPATMVLGQGYPVRITYEDASGVLQEVEQDGTHMFRWVMTT
jgi:hypothetical protein